MRTVADLEPISVASASWSAICERHPNEWVCLLDVERRLDGSIHSARVVSHDRSIERALDQVDPSDPDTTVVHTAGRPLWTPRIEVVDESRDIIPPRR